MSIAETNPISSHLRDFLKESQGDSISFRQIIESFEDREYALLSLFFALIAAIPIPGVHAILGLPIFLVSIQRVIGIKKIWMPDLLMKQTISRDAFAGMVDKALPYIEKIEKFCKPRLTKCVTGNAIWILAIVGAFLSTIIVIPGPFTNFIPSISICVIAIGILTKDGLIAIIGAVVGIVFSIILSIVYITAILFVIQSILSWL